MRKLQRSLLASAVALALAASGTAAAQFSNVYLLRRQPDRRRLLQARAAARHRTVHDESRPGLGAGVRATLRLRRHTRRTRAAPTTRKAARASRACRASRRSPPTGSRGADRDAGHAIPRARVRPIRTRSTRSGAAPTTSSSSSASRRPARRRPRRCRPHVGTRRGPARHAGRERCNAGGAQYIIVCNLPDIGKTPERHRVRARRASITALSSFFNTHAASARSTPRGIQTIRVNTFALFNEIARQSGALTASRTRPTPACGATPSLLCTPATLRHAERAADLSLRRRRASDDRRARDHRADSCNR